MRVFVTVGSQMPFDRLVRAMDAWAAAHPQAEVSAQIGITSYVPTAMHAQPMMTPRAFDDHVRAAQVVVAHAGMGSVLTAMAHAKALVLLPRLGSLRETRNDHQVATARWLAGKPGIWVAEDEGVLGDLVTAAAASAEQPPTASLDGVSGAPPELQRFRAFLDGWIAGALDSDRRQSDKT